MKSLNIIGIDLAKNVFYVHGMTPQGRKLFSRKLTRNQVTAFFANQPRSLVGMESCASSLYWSRIIEECGHEVRRMPAQFVAPYRRGNKTDATDAAAICEAVQRPNMRFVPNKNQEQADIQAIHRVRSGFVRSRTAVINQARGLLAENGIIIPQGARRVRSELARIIDDEQNGLSGLMRQLLNTLYAYLVTLEEHIAHQNELISQVCKNNDDCKRLLKIPGIGVMTATLLLSLSGNVTSFKNGREFSSYVGLTPKEHSSGGKQRLGGITKRGNAYARTLLVHGARSVISMLKLGHIPYNSGPMYTWLQRLVETKGTQKACVALANKNARIAWNILTKKTDFQIPMNEAA